ncbi:response regulator [Pseudorhodoferax soli]|uniref:LuxR family two component transcriptional regulator n=1 Tax=Pseudorhodoferax soli TaxID=545864 RepID=A0A368XST7_9BURK|nr:response regulator transcription factor [Pseudorhodoferax soli]RCW70236.1 LuxR family two component transcriptional regulator [Pseudorhodoferax soli]
MRVLIVDDHEVIWNGMRLTLERLSNQANRRPLTRFEGSLSVEAAVELEDRSFDLILLDYHLAGLSGTAALARMREVFEASPIVILSADADPRRAREAILGGAAGYIPKTMSDREMQAALALVLAQGIYLPPMALLEVDEDPPAEPPDLPAESIESFLRSEFSPRQREVFALALRGKPNKVIARELGIAEGTVKVHLSMVFRALGVRNRTEAMYRVLSADAAGAIERL